MVDEKAMRDLMQEIASDEFGRINKQIVRIAKDLDK